MTHDELNDEGGRQLYARPDGPWRTNLNNSVRFLKQQTVLELERYQQRLRELKVTAETEGLVFWLDQASKALDGAIDHIVAADLLRRAQMDRDVQKRFRALTHGEFPLTPRPGEGNMI
jgi:hypothetical protein